MKPPYNLMIGPAKSGKGGISTVITQYEENGLIAALRAEYYASWVNGNAFKKLWAIIAITCRLIAGLIGKKIRIVHVHSACRNSFLRKSIFITIGKALRAPVVFHLHSGEFFAIYKSSNTLYRWWIRTTLNRCAAIILLSERWRQEMLPLVDSPGKIHIIHNPIDLRLPVNYTRRPRSPDRLNLLFLGKIDDNKGIFDLIPVVSALRQKGLNIVVRCGGNGEVERLKTTLAKYQLEEVFQPLGWINFEQKIREFETADVFILPSYYEGQPMAVLEAMMAGVLVVSTTVGGIPDIITDGKEGFLVPPGDAAAMQTLLEKIYADPHCGDQIIRQAKDKATAMHNPQQILSKLRSLYHTIDDSNLK